MGEMAHEPQGTKKRGAKHSGTAPPAVAAE